MIFSSDYFEQLVRALVAYQKGQQGRSLKSIVGQAQRHQEAEIERLHSERDAYEVQVSELEEEVRLAKAELVHITREWERCLLENKEIIERLNRAVQENFNLREEVLGLAEQLRELQEGLPEVGSLGASLGAVEGLMGILEDCKTGSPIVDLQIRQAIGSDTCAGSPQRRLALAMCTGFCGASSGATF